MNLRPDAFLPGVRGAGNPRTALLCYITEPFVAGPHPHHQNQFQAIAMADILADLGFAVDVVSYLAKDLVRFPRRYDLVLELHPTSPAFWNQVAHPGTLRVGYGTESNPSFNNAADLDRLRQLADRRGVRLESPRLTPPLDRGSMEALDLWLLVGNRRTLSTYDEFRLADARLLSNTGYPRLVPPGEGTRSRNRFAFIGSGGQVHRGLDWALEHFARHPELELFVFSPFAHEPEFCRAYENELFQTPNIHAMGFVDVHSEGFLDVARTCRHLLYPSCSEGMSGSVLVGMSCGMLPVVTPECGFPAEETVPVEGTTPAALERALARALAMDDASVEAIVAKNRGLLETKYSMARFESDFRDAISEALRRRSDAGRSTRPSARPRAVGDDAIRMTAVVSTHASAALLPSCLDDLRAQSLGEALEVIVVDSGSPQDEASIVAAYQERMPNLRYVRTERESLYAAWNRGVELARGAYVTNANTDDAHHPRALEYLARALDAHPEADLAFADNFWTDRPNDVWEETGAKRRLVEYPDYHPATTAFWCTLGPHPVWRRSLFGKIGLFDPSFKAAGDLEFQMRFTQAGCRAVHVPLALSLFYQNPDGLSLADSTSLREQRAAFGRHRETCPISRMFRLEPGDPSSEAAAWISLGHRALHCPIPWDRPASFPDFAVECFRRALAAVPGQEHALAGLDEIGRAFGVRLVDPPPAPPVAPRPAEPPPAVAPLRWSPVEDARRTPPSPAHPVVAVDARTLFVRDSVDRGIGQYTLHHLLALARTRPEATLRLLTDHRDGSERIGSLLSLPNVEIRPWSPDAVRDADLYHVPDPMGRPYLGADPFALSLPGRTSSIFYDVIPRRVYWESIPSDLKALDEVSLRAVADRADAVLCISEHTRRDFLEETGRAPDGVEVILGGCNAGDHRGVPADAGAVRRRLGIREKFFLHVGSIDPHKNLAASLNAFAAVRRSRECSFVVAGRKLASHRETEKAVRDAGLVDVVFTDFLEPAELDALYGAATALLFPSRYEGFGFPVLEAMAAGCPVIASNATSVPEVAGEAALSRSPDDIQGIAIDMARLLDDLELRRNLSEAGKARAALFRWSDVADRTWRSWDRLLAAPSADRALRESAGSVRWISPVWDPSGYADESRAFLKHLASTDLGVSARPWGRHSETFRLSASPADRGILDAALRREVLPGSPVVLDIPASALGRVPGAGHHVGRTTFETDGLPPDWVARCNAMDEIWVPCAFNRETFAKAGVNRPILVVPEGVDTDRFRPDLEPLELPGPRRGTTCLAVFEWTHRKAPDLLLQAWATAFSAADDVRLVLRTYPPNQIEGDPVAWVEAKIDEELSRVGKRRAECAPIAVIARQVPDADMPRLYAAADVYLAPSRGEGWGRPHMEAMSCGVPVIATRWSGNLEFQTDDNSWLIGIEGLEEIDAREEFPFYRGQRWAKPSLTDFVDLLRASLDPAARREKAVRARADMVRKWDWSRIAPLAEIRLREILSNIPADRSALVGGSRPEAAMPDSLSAPIRWAGPVFNFSGYARLARETLKGLMEAGMSVSCDPQLNDKDFFLSLSGKDAEVARWRSLLGTTPRQGPLVICDIPRDTKGADILAALSRDNAACEKRICWTMFETDRLPEGWAASLNAMDEVWVPSHFNRATFARSGVVESKLHVVPGCIDAKPYAAATPRTLPGSGYTFLSVFQWIERKGWDVLLDAWSRAFRPGDPVRLVLRCHPFGKAEPVAAQLEKFLASRGTRRENLAPIHLLEEFLPDDALPGLFAAADCFVLPSRGEGWGLPYLEAMAAGKPVIGTRWSAQTDFLTPDNSWLLSPRDPVDVSDAACREVPFLDISHRWADPSVDELAKLLRHAFEHPEEGRSKGRRGRQDATTLWTPARTVRAIAERLAAPASASAPTRMPKSATRTTATASDKVSAVLAKVAARIKAAPVAPLSAPQANPDARPFLSIRWEGSQFVHHSLAHVNREMCLRLAKAGHDLSVVPFEPDQFGPDGDPDLSLLAQLHGAPLEGPSQIHVRHQWPPNLVAPAQGKWVVVQPWEFGSPPKEWIPVFSKRIDELWAYTNHVRDMYLESGIPAEKVHVVPLGVDCERFRPGLEPFPLRTRKSFRFLYVGGTIARKGFDVLLNAWKEAFGPQDDVCLVVKDMGGGSFYKGQTAAAWIRELQESGRCAEIEYLDTDLLPGQIPSLYAACDVLVHPYRGEGFGLPIAEAMACGLPCVVTRGGAADDFCGEAESWGVTAERVPVPGGKVGPFETVAEPWWLEPSPAHLVERLREARSDAAVREAKGRAARERIATHFTWDHAAAAAEARLFELSRRETTALRPAPGKVTISSLDKLAKSITMESARRKESPAPAPERRGPEEELQEMGRMLLQAEAAAARGGLDEAERITGEVVAKFPRQHMAWLARAMVLRGLGRFPKAIEAIGKCLRERETPEALLESIQIHVLAKELGAARKFEKALKERHAAWTKVTREEFRATGKAWPPDFLKPAKAAKAAPPVSRRARK